MASGPGLSFEICGGLGRSLRDFGMSIQVHACRASVAPAVPDLTLRFCGPLKRDPKLGKYQNPRLRSRLACTYFLCGRPLASDFPNSLTA